ncbi:hypothetical protein, conserved [Eimeria maxima]|uniref:Uncharacterized protein n=1 Tax=Eimeria maxima TaxID=5804 RepID=U6MC75_EIMMA|nr:hypothetical protein, conserved [Eimeria maxima]CDJ60663.1 hypothetical protein, conserved [Eimeria maxima]
MRSTAGGWLGQHAAAQSAGGQQQQQQLQREQQEKAEEASKASAAALQKLNRIEMQIMQHTRVLRRRVAAQKTERLLGLMLLGKPHQLDELMDRLCTARLRLDAVGKAKFVEILAKAFQDPNADLRALANTSLHTTEEIEDFCEWLQSGIAFGKETKRLSPAQLRTMQQLLTDTASLHPAEGQFLDRWTEGMTFKPNAEIQRIWDEIPNPPKQQQQEQQQEQQQPQQEQQQQQQDQQGKQQGPQGEGGWWV